MNPPFTAESLTDEIEATREAFQRLNDTRPLTEIRRVTVNGHTTEYIFAPLAQSAEQALCVLAERIDRLYKFRALIAAKQYSEELQVPRVAPGEGGP